MWFLAAIALFYLSIGSLFILCEIFGPFGAFLPLALVIGYLGMDEK